MFLKHKKLMFILLKTFWVVFPLGLMSVSDEEINALMDLYEISNKLIWNVTDILFDSCQLMGIICYNNSITQIYLDETFGIYQHSLPNSISNLTDLEVISITNNYINAFPSVLCELKYIQVININNNSIYDTIPDCLTQLSSLVILEMNHNRLYGALSLDFPSLTFISVSFNQLSIIVSDINVHQYVLLDLSNNEFKTFNVNNSATDSCLLKTIYINDNKMDIDLAWINHIINNCNNIERIAMHNNHFKGNLNEFISANKSHMHLLSMHNNNIYSSSLENDLSQLISKNKLETLSIYNNDFTGELPINLFSPELVRFYAHNLNIYGRIPSNRYIESNVLDLTLFNNNLGCELPNNIINTGNESYNNTILLLIGNRFNCKGFNSLPSYINEDFRDAFNLYINEISKYPELAILGVSGLCCVFLVCYRIYVTLMKLKRSFFPSRYVI